MASSGRATAVKGGTGTLSTPANSVGGESTSPTSSSPTQRRGSQSSGPLFSSLMNQKRNSTDAAAQARRQSFNDQKPATGFIGKLWNNFTMGTTGTSNK